MYRAQMSSAPVRPTPMNSFAGRAGRIVKVVRALITEHFVIETTVAIVASEENSERVFRIAGAP